MVITTGEAIFVIGFIIISLVTTMFIFVFKNQIWSVVAMIMWSIFTFNRFQQVATQWDINYDLAMMGGAMIFLSITTLFWAFKAEKATQVTPVDNREEWEIDDEKKQKRMRYLKRYRPKRRKPII